MLPQVKVNLGDFMLQKLITNWEYSKINLLIASAVVIHAQTTQGHSDSKQSLNQSSNPSACQLSLMGFQKNEAWAEGKFKPDEDPTQILNKRMSQRYPALSYFLKDPNDFFIKMEDRFIQQKLKHPHDPYNFDFTEGSLSVLSWMQVQLEALLDKSFRSIATHNTENQKISESLIQDILNQERFAIELKRDVDNNLKAIQEGQSVSYRKMAELSYFFSRCTGQRKDRDLNLFHRVGLEFDRWVNGVTPLSSLQEYLEYRQGKKITFQKPSGHKGFRDSETVYLKQIYDTEKLNFITLFVHQPIDRDIFYRLFPTKFFLRGKTTEPILADGFLRPDFDFDIHDDRHSSGIAYEWDLYRRRTQLKDFQEENLRKKMDSWLLQFDQKLFAVEDEDLKQAIVLVSFNYHHDRGYPFVPSSGMQIRQNFLIYPLYFMMKVSGQGVDFSNPIQHIPEAQNWIEKFWEPLMPQELEILNQRVIRPERT